MDLHHCQNKRSKYKVNYQNKMSINTYEYFQNNNLTNQFWRNTSKEKKYQFILNNITFSKTHVIPEKIYQLQHRIASNKITPNKISSHSTHSSYFCGKIAVREEILQYYLYYPNVSMQFMRKEFQFSYTYINDVVQRIIKL